MRWKSIVPSEHQEQKKVIEWCVVNKHLYPDAGYIFAIPNGALRPYRHRVVNGRVVRYSNVAKKLRAEGVRPGVPDLFLPVPRETYHGLFIEMKRRDGDPTLNQLVWKGLLTSKGYAVYICRGADEAIEAIKGYLEVD